MNTALNERRMYICGTEGTIRGDVISGELEYKVIGHKEKIRRLKTKGKGGHGGSDVILGKEVVQSVLRGREPSATIMDGFISTVASLKINEAMQKKKVVELGSMWKKYRIF